MTPFCNLFMERPSYFISSKVICLRPYIYKARHFSLHADLSVYLTELRHSAINLRRQIAKKMRIFTDFCYHSHRFFSIATGLQLICEFAAQNSQTSRNIIANSQSIRKLFSRRSCDIRKNVVRMSYDVLANVAWLSQTSRSNTLRMNCEFSRVYIYI